MIQENTIDINIEFTFNDKNYTTELTETDAENDLEFLIKETICALDYAETSDLYRGGYNHNPSKLRAKYICEDIQRKIVDEIDDQDLCKDEYDVDYSKNFNKNLIEVYAYIDGGKKYDVTNNIKMQYNDNN